jgi:hypothetical protein
MRRLIRVARVVRKIGLIATYKLIIRKLLGRNYSDGASDFQLKMESLENFLDPKFRYQLVQKSPYQVTFVIPEIREQIFYGGYLAFLGFLNKANDEGLNCRVVLFNQSIESAKSEIDVILKKDTSSIFRILGSVDIDSFVSSRVCFNPEEIVVTYNAHITHFLDELSRNRRLRNVFLFQEDERIFFPNGSMRSAIESTYKLDFFPIYSSPLLKEEIEKQFESRSTSNAMSECFTNPILLNQPILSSSISNEKTLIIYARPEAHASRNLTELALLGARKFMESMPRRERSSWKIIGIGGSKKERMALSQDIEIQMLGKLNLEEYAKILAGAKVGLSLMYAPHPSIPPFEFVSFGIPTVTNHMGNRTKQWYSDTSNLFFTCDATVGDIAKNLENASNFSGVPRIPKLPKSYQESLSHINFSKIRESLSLS